MADIRIIPALGEINITGSAEFKGAGGSSLLFITGSGGIGVKTTVPASELHVLGSGTRFFTLDRSGTRSWDLGVNSSGTFLITDNTEAADRIAINLSGSVGIGTTNPGKILTIQPPNASDNGIRLITSAGQNLINLYQENGSEAFIRMYSANSEKIQLRANGNSYLNGGNVGIGTDSPAVRLHAVTAAANGQYRLETTHPSGIPNLELKGDSSATIRYISGSSNVIHSRIDFRQNGLYLLGDGATNQLVVKDTGAVQITDYGSGNNTGTATYNLSVDASGNIIETANPATGVVDGSGTANYIPKWSDSDTLTNSVIYDNGTNVGIGTSSTGTYRLNVNGISYFGNTIYNGGGYISWTTGYGDGTTQTYNANSLAFLSNASSYAVRMFISSGGNVGIGSTAPSAKLNVVGSADVLIVEGSGSTSNTTIMAVDGNNGRLFEVSDDLSDSLFSVNTIAGLPVMEAFADNVVTLGAYNQYDLHITGSQVGIGASAPQAKLHVSGSTNTKIYVQNGTNTGDAGFYVVDEGGTEQYKMYYDYPNNRAYQEFNGNGLTFYSAQQTAEVAKFGIGAGYLDSFFSGSVGVGTTSPARKLDVRGGTSGNINSRVLRLAEASNADRYDFSLETANALRLNEGVSDAALMTWQNNGNVGIGTTAPDSKLHVSGANATNLAHFETLRAKYKFYSDSTSTYTTLFNMDDTGLDIGHDSSLRSINLKTNSQDRVTILGGGSVGIGSISPAYKLDVNGTARIQDSLYLGSADVASGHINAYELMTFNIDTDNDDADTRYFGWFKNGAAGSGTSLMRLLETGNLGIGTDSPSNILNIYEDSTSVLPQVRIENDGTGDAAITLVATGITGWSLGLDNSDSDKFKIGKGAAAVSTDTKLTINSDGNLGVGTTAPARHLHVNDDSSYAGVQVQASASQDSFIEFISTNTVKMGIDASQDVFKVANTNFSGTGFVLNTAGNLGIGTTNPFKPLHVQSSNDAPIRVESTDPTTGILFVDSNSSNALYYVGSGDYFYTTSTLGIGTSSPTGKFNSYISATRQITHNGNGGDLSVISDNNTTPVFYVKGTGTADLVNVFDDTAEVFTILDGGSVGIGTSAPAHKLEVYENGADAIVRIHEDAGTHNARLHLRSGGNDTWLQNLPGSFEIRTEGTLSSGPAPLGISAAGNVSLGYDLDVTGIITAKEFHTTFVSASIIYQSGSTKFGNSTDDNHDFTGSLSLLSNSGATGLTVARGSSLYVKINNDSTRQIFTYATDLDFRNINGTSIMYLSGSGNVGIGTNAPSARLHVSDTSNASNAIFNTRTNGGYITLQEAGTDRAYLQWGLTYNGQSGGNYLLLTNIENGGSVSLQTKSSGGTYNSAALVVNSDGNVGIGTTGPDSPLNVYRSTATPASSTGTTLLSLQNYVGSDLSQQKTFIDFNLTDDNANFTPQVRIGAEVGRNADANAISKEGAGAFIVYTADGTDEAGAGSLTEKMRVDYAGNVGIGTATPTHRLHVNSGAAFIKSNLNDGSPILTIRSSDNYGYSFARSNNTGFLEFDGNQSGYIGYVFKNGNVGIGTTSPNYTLEVRKDVDTWVASIHNTGSDANAQGLLVRSEATAAHDASILGVYADSGYKMMVKSTGNVGINTTAPTAKLHVRGEGATSATYAAKFTDSTGGNIMYMRDDGVVVMSNGYLYVDHADGIYSSGKVFARAGVTDDGGNLGLGGHSSVGNLTLSGSVVASFAGSVGIGTTAPDDKLEVSGNVRITNNSPILYFYDTDVTDLRHRILGGGNAGLEYSADIGNVTAGYHRWDIANSEKMRLIEGGNLGLGTATPTAGLHISRSMGAAWLVSFENQSTSGHGLIIRAGGTTGTRYITQWYDAAGNERFHMDDTGEAYFQNDIATDGEIIFDDNNSVGQSFVKSGGDLNLIIDSNNNTNTAALIVEKDTQTAGSGTELFRIQEDGNVGIGLANPGYKLDVFGSARIGGVTGDAELIIEADTDNSGENDNPRIILKQDGAIVQGTIGFNGDADNAFTGALQNAMYISTYDALQLRGGSGGIVTIDGNGNVGIGSTVPSYKLEIDANTNSLINVRNGANKYLNSTNFGYSVAYKVMQIGDWYGKGSSGVALALGIDPALIAGGAFFGNEIALPEFTEFITANAASGSATDWNQNVLVISGSNIGVGTSSPSDILHVYKSGADTRLIVGNNTTYDQFIYFKGNTDWSMGIDYSNSNAFTLSNYSSIGTNDRITVTTGGSVGINTTSVYQKLHVNGNIYLGDNSTTGEFIHSGTSVALSADTNILIVADANDTSGATPGGEIIFGMGTATDTNGTPSFTWANAYPTNVPRNEWMRISNTGNVGIGITNPNAPLNINIGSGGTDGITGLKIGGTGNYPSIELGTYGAYGGMLRSYGNDLFYFAGHWRTIGNTASENHYHAWYTSKSGSTDWSTVKMKLDHEGNLGVGTSSTTAKLEVAGTNGNIKIGDASNYNGISLNGTLDIANYNLLSRSSDKSLYINRPTGNNIYFREQNSGNQMFIESGGNVGINTTTPSAKLNVVGGADVLIVEGSGSTANTTIMAVDGNNGRLFEVSDDLSDSLFSVNTIAGLPVMEAFADNTVVLGAYNQCDLVVTGSQVGIGTCSPQAKVHVSGSARIEGTIYSGDNGISTNNSLQLSYSAQSGVGTIAAKSTGGSTTLALQTSDSGTTADRLYIASNGNVGIGTASPSYKLHVDNDALNTNSPALYVRNPNSAASGVIAEFVGDSDSIQIRNISTGGDYAIYNTQQNNGIALYDGTGGVEIHYNGATVLEADSNGGIKVTGQLSATADVIAYSSDERLKENIKPIENAVDKVKQMRGVTFDWNKKSEELGFEPTTKLNDVGVIAQEVEKVFPQLIAHAPFDIDSDEEGNTISKSGEDYKTVNYSRLTAVLIEAIKEQQEQIEELKEEIKKLKG